MPLAVAGMALHPEASARGGTEVEAAGRQKPQTSLCRWRTFPLTHVSRVSKTMSLVSALCRRQTLA